ncbi:hypothetical protein ISCGN_032711 [Ixodes scapularis]
MSDYLSGLSKISEAPYTTKLGMNNVTCGDSFRVDATEWTLKPDFANRIAGRVDTRPGGGSEGRDLSLVHPKQTARRKTNRTGVSTEYADQRTSRKVSVAQQRQVDRGRRKEIVQTSHPVSDRPWGILVSAATPTYPRDGSVIQGHKACFGCFDAPLRRPSKSCGDVEMPTSDWPRSKV